MRVGWVGVVASLLLPVFAIQKSQQVEFEVGSNATLSWIGKIDKFGCRFMITEKNNETEVTCCYTSEKWRVGDCNKLVQAESCRKQDSYLVEEKLLVFSDDEEVNSESCILHLSKVRPSDAGEYIVPGNSRNNGGIVLNVRKRAPVTEVSWTWQWALIVVVLVLIFFFVAGFSFWLMKIRSKRLNPEAFPGVKDKKEKDGLIEENQKENEKNNKEVEIEMKEDDVQNKRTPQGLDTDIDNKTTGYMDDF